MKPKVAIFDFASCEGCQLQIVNLEEHILDLVERVDVVSFREAMKEDSDEYDIAFVEGSIQRPMDVDRIKQIRSKAKILIALGDCAVTGCVNKLRNAFSLDDPLEEVYDDSYPSKSRLFDLRKARALDEVVVVDFYIRGCPVRKEQVIYYVKRLSWMPLHSPMDIRFRVTEKSIPVDDRSLVLYNPHKCILCRRCDIICREALGVDALGMVGKGPEIVVATPKNIGFDSNGCIRCGQCVSSCSCGSLETKSCIPELMKEFRKEKEMTIAVDSIALASYIEKNLYLKEIEPSIAEKYVVGALKQAGFKDVIQYDRFLLESVKRDTVNGNKGGIKVLSWCKAAFNYVQPRIRDSKFAWSEENAPWRLLLNEKRERSVCLLSPCTALKGVEEFTYVMSVMELDELFKKMEIDLEFTEPKNYQGEVRVGRDHPGFSSVRLKGINNVYSIRISKGFMDRINETNVGFLDLFPCLDRCLSGGGNYPTVEREVIMSRRRWLESLWEVGA